MKLITIIIKQFLLVLFILNQFLLVVFISLFIAGCSGKHDLPDVEGCVIPISEKVENKSTRDGWKFEDHPVFPGSALAPRS